jgi:hypothetical protein
MIPTDYQNGFVWSACTDTQSALVSVHALSVFNPSTNVTNTFGNPATLYVFQAHGLGSLGKLYLTTTDPALSNTLAPQSLCSNIPFLSPIPTSGANCTFGTASASGTLLDCIVPSGTNQLEGLPQEKEYIQLAPGQGLLFLITVVAPSWFATIKWSEY